VTGPLFLLDLPRWDGGRPSRDNGLVFGAAQLAFALASMAVSKTSYGRDGRPKRVMWFRDR
jgi:hypothetical protein